MTTHLNVNDAYWRPAKFLITLLDELKLRYQDQYLCKIKFFILQDFHLPVGLGLGLFLWAEWSSFRPSCLFDFYGALPLQIIKRFIYLFIYPVDNVKAKMRIIFMSCIV